MRPRASSHDSREPFGRWLSDAHAGDRNALGRLFQYCRGYLLAVAQGELDSALRPKTGGSDLVQETFLEAQRKFDRFQGTTPDEMIAWLRAILLNKLDDLTNRYRGTQKRQVDREVALEAGGAAPAARDVASEAATPSQHLMKLEGGEAVRRALDQLPPQYRQVLLWRHWEDLPFTEIARRLQRSLGATYMIWSRAINRMRRHMGQAP